SGAESGTTGSTDGRSAAEAEGGAVQVAGAVGVSVVDSRAQALIPDGRTIIAGTGDKVTDGAVTLRAENNTDSVALADASATVEAAAAIAAKNGDKSETSSDATAGTSTGDVNVTKALENQRESTLAVNPANTQNIIVGANNFPGIFGDTEVPGNGTDDDGDGVIDEPAVSRDSVWVTTDGGATWSERVIPVPAGATGSHGDPTIAFSRDGKM